MKTILFKKQSVTIFLVAVFLAVTAGLLSMGGVARAESETVAVTVQREMNYNNAQGYWEGETPKSGAGGSVKIAPGTGTNLMPSAVKAAALKFTVPVAGQISIVNHGGVALLNGAHATGARFRAVFKGKVVYPSDGGWFVIPNDGANHPISIGTLDVAQGDELWYIVDNGGDGNADYDAVQVIMAFTFNGAWYDNASGYYNDNDISGDDNFSEGLPYPKNELLTFHETYVLDSSQTESVNQDKLAVIPEGTNHDMFFDSNENASTGGTYKGAVSQLSQIEKYSMHMMGGTYHAIEAEMPAAGTLKIQDTWFKMDNKAFSVRLLKNNLKIYPESQPFAEINAQNTAVRIDTSIEVAKGDILRLQITCEEDGTYLFFDLNYSLFTGSDVLALVHSQAFGKSESAFEHYVYSPFVPLDPLGEPDTGSLGNVDVIEYMPLIKSGEQWRSSPESYCRIWLGSGEVAMHTQGTTLPTLSFQAPSNGKLQLTDVKLAKSVSEGDGVQFRLILKQGDSFLHLYPADAGWQQLAPGESTDFSTAVRSVGAGDEILLVLHPKNSNLYDQTNVSFKLLFQSEDQANPVAYSPVEDFKLDQSGPFKYMYIEIPPDYSGTTVEDAVDREFKSVKDGLFVKEEMIFSSQMNKWTIIGQSFFEIKLNEISPSLQYAAAVAFEIPEDGRLDVSGAQVQHAAWRAEPDENGDISDGVRFRIMKNNEIVFPAGENDWQVLDGSQVFTVQCDAFSVKQGDVIYFIVDSITTANYDTTSLNFAAHFAKDGDNYTTTFDNVRDFKSTGENFSAFSYYGVYFKADSDIPGDPDQKPDKPACGAATAEMLSLSMGLLVFGIAAMSLIKRGGSRKKTARTGS